MAYSEFKVDIVNDLKEIIRLADFVDDLGEKYNFPPDVVFKVNLSLDELITNIISYGYEDNQRHTINVNFIIDDNMLNIEIIDEGKPFDPLEREDPNITLEIKERSIGGLGIYFVKSFMDSVKYTRKGNKNILFLSKKIN